MSNKPPHDVGNPPAEKDKDVAFSKLIQLRSDEIQLERARITFQTQAYDAQTKLSEKHLELYAADQHSVREAHYKNKIINCVIGAVLLAAALLAGYYLVEKGQIDLIVTLIENLVLLVVGGIGGAGIERFRRHRASLVQPSDDFESPPRF